jgi:hypothetical protein
MANGLTAISAILSASVAPAAIAELVIGSL